MAFRTYKDQFNPSRVPWGGSAPKQKSDRTWRQVSSPDDDPNTIRLGQPASMKDRLDVTKSMVDIQKDQQVIEGKNMEAMGDDMVFRAVFGHPKKELNDVLASSTTGYQDLGAQKFQKDPFAIERMRAGLKPPRSAGNNTFEERQKVATERALQHIGTYKKGQKSWDDIWGTITAAPNFKDADITDPRFEQARQAFESQPENVPAWKKYLKGFSEKVFGGDESPDAPATVDPNQKALDYLKSIGAKETPANIEWATKKTGG